MGRKISTQDLRKAVGPCPKCGRGGEHLWFNNVPLTAYCWGAEGDEHPELSRVVPDPHQIYGSVGTATEWKYRNGRRFRKAEGRSE